MDKCSPQPVQSPEGCLIFSQSWKISYSRSVDLGGATFCFGSGGTSLVTVRGLVAYSTTIHAKVIGQMTLLLLLGKFTIFCNGIRDGRLGESGGTKGLVRLVIGVCCFCWSLLAVDCSWLLESWGFLSDLLLLDWLNLSEWDFLQSHSQWWASIECARFFNSVRVEGLPTWCYDFEQLSDNCLYSCSVLGKLSIVYLVLGSIWALPECHLIVVLSERFESKVVQ